MKLCVVIPALNEQATIVSVIEGIPRDIPGIREVAIVVVDDGSTDDTAALARQAGALIVRHSENRGVGAAFQTGVEKALELGADLMVNIDADGQFNPRDIPTLVEPLLRREAQFVSASRFMNKELVPDMPRAKYYGNKGMSALISWLTRRKFYDVSCGFRGYTRDTLLRLGLLGGFTYTQETFLDLSFKGTTMCEVPIRVRGTRQYGESRVAASLLKYAANTSKIIFRSFRDYKPMRFFSAISGVMFVLAFCSGGFLLTHYVRTGALTPHKWAGFATGFLAGLGVLVLVTGTLADMFTRVRVNQERILYELRKRIPPRED